MNVLLLVENDAHSCNKETLIQNSDYFKAMFSGKFLEKLKNEIRLFGVNSTALQLLIHSLENKEEIQINENNAMILLQTSGMLQFESVHKKCKEYLYKTLTDSNTLSYMNEWDSLGENELFEAAQKRALCHFTSVFLSVQTFNIYYFRQLIMNPSLRVQNESEILSVLLRVLVSEEDKKEMLFYVNFNKISQNELRNICQNQSQSLVSLAYKLQNSNHGPIIHRAPLYPALICRQSVVKDNKTIHESHILLFKPQDKSLKPFISLIEPLKSNDIHYEPNGYKANSNGEEIYLVGGVYDLGSSNWNKALWSYNILFQKWNYLGEINICIRHHSLLLFSSTLILIGGYSKHRILCDKMTFVDLESLNTFQRDCPETGVSPAVVIYQESLLYYFKSKVYSLDLMTTHQESEWKVLNEEIPHQRNFNWAVTSKNVIYLTSNVNRDLYSYTPGVSFELLGYFNYEVQNSCLVDDIIYSFFSDTFEETFVIETYDLVSKDFKILWKISSFPFDFSPYFSTGCFPLLQY